MSLIFPNIKPELIVEINISGEYETELFPSKDIYAKVACHILRGGKLNVIGFQIDSFLSFKTNLPVLLNKENTLIGIVIYIDRFGNLVTNIEKDFFLQKKEIENLSYIYQEE